MYRRTLLASLTFLLFLSISTFAEMPKTINFQGRLVNNNVAATGSGSILFKIYSSSQTGATAIWSETDTVNFDNNGVFSVQLGTVTPLNMDFNQPLWVEMTYPSTATTPLSPKQQLNTSPYSFFAVTAESVVNGGVPIGTVLASAVPVTPEGYLECAGQSVPVAAYPVLAQALSNGSGGYIYGGTGGNFNTPDYRGYFLRGWDRGAGVDPDSASRTLAGVTKGNVIGSVQGDDLKAHNHSYNQTTLDTTYLSQAGTNRNNPNGQSGATTGTSPSTGGNETRPKNIYVMYIIRAK
jgi:microcystin-dependent protein